MNRLFSTTLLVIAYVSLVDTPLRGQGNAGDPTVPSNDLRELFDKPAAERQEAPTGIVEITLDEEDSARFAQVRFVGVSLGRVADELGRTANSNVVVSRVVADRSITITLRNIELEAVLSAIAISQGLVARYDGERGVHFLASAEEVRGDLSTFLATKTEDFTLLYPNSSDVVRAIRNAFGERVIVREENQNQDQTLEELQNRFRRFDIVEGRSRGLSGSSGGTAVQSSQGNQFGNNRFDNLSRLGSQGGNRASRPQDFRSVNEPDLTESQARILAEARAGAADAAAEAQRIANRQATTYVTAVQRLNRIVVRSGDPQLMDEIRGLIQRLDVPTPLMLLEVRVLRVDLSDGMDSSFDVAFQRGDAQASFSGGEIAAPSVGSILPGGTGVDLSAGVFQVVSSTFQARLQLLQAKGRVTSLATPILLTANGEVSRIFSGEQVPIVVGFTEPQVIVGDGATTTLSATPVTELRDVGTDLLVTGNINADRTVTLRLLQETSSVNVDGASILVPTGGSFTSQTVDTVQSQSASGTIVARDGLLLAFGGLIEETESDQRQQLPVLGDLPLIGFLFRRDSSVIRRNELIVLVRPYVLSTPVEGDQISRNLLQSLSIHPYRPGDGAKTGDKDDWGVFRDHTPPFDRSIFDLFRFHTIPSLNVNQPDGTTP